MEIKKLEKGDYFLYQLGMYCYDVGEYRTIELYLGERISDECFNELVNTVINEVAKDAAKNPKKYINQKSVNQFMHSQLSMFDIMNGIADYLVKFGFERSDCSYRYESSGDDLGADIYGYAAGFWEAEGCDNVAFNDFVDDDLQTKIYRLYKKLGEKFIADYLASHC